ncbi:MAG: Elongation factor P [uncultured bacterium]|nr:MAG: Elongation factor P [uncultured bacterium]HBD05424.1 elongation factor P [Candidatus Uhrbacteria bacterium]
MGSPNDIKKGVVLNYKDGLYAVVDFQHVNPGKGSAFVRTRLKNLSTGKVVENTFKSAETIDFEQVTYRKMQYLFTDGNQYTFMDNVSYEQVEVPADQLGDDAKYLKEGIEATVILHNDRAIAIELPKKIQYTVASSPPAVKGDTASGNVTKEVVLDNGMTARVPIFIKEGDKIIIKTETGEYSERVS